MAQQQKGLPKCTQLYELSTDINIQFIGASRTPRCFLFVDSGSAT